MTLYAFHPCGADGKSNTVLYEDLPDHADAYLRASDMIHQHPECLDVVVCQGEQRIFSRSWRDPELESVLSRPLSS